MSDKPEDDGFVTGDQPSDPVLPLDDTPAPDPVPIPGPGGTEPVPEPPPPPTDLELRWGHFEALAGDVVSVINHLANVLPSASPLGRIADGITARLAQFKELIAGQQK